MPKTESKSSTVKAFASKLGGLKSHWKEARKSRNTSVDKGEIAAALGIPEEGGTVTVCARLKRINVGLSKRQTPFVQFNFVVSRGPGKGTQLTKYTDIAKSKSGKVTAEERFDQVVADIAAIGYDLSTLEFEQFAEALEEQIIPEVAAESPEVQIRVKYDGEWLNVDINRLVEDGDGEAEEEAETDDAGDDSGDDDGSTASSDDDDLDDEEEEEDPYVPAKGDKVLWTPPKARKARTFEVVSVKRSDNSTTLKDAQGKHAGVPWDELTPIE